MTPQKREICTKISQMDFHSSATKRVQNVHRGMRTFRIINVLIRPLRPLAVAKYKIELRNRKRTQNSIENSHLCNFHNRNNDIV